MSKNIKAAKNTLKAQIDFLEKLLKDLNMNNLLQFITEIDTAIGKLHCQVSGIKLDKCRHESDGRKYSSSPIDCIDFKNKCIKCGEFYR